MYPTGSDDIIPKPQFNSLTEALLYTREANDVYALKVAAAKATIRKYVDVKRAQVGHDYTSPRDGKPVHFETASYGKLKDDLQLFRKQLQEIKVKSGVLPSFESLL